MPTNHYLIDRALLGRQLPARSLRIAFIHPAVEVARWAIETIRILQQAPQIEICAAVACGDCGPIPEGRGFTHALFHYYQHRGRSFATQLEPVPLYSVLDSGLLREFNSEDALEYLKKLDLDVVVCFDSRLPGGSYAGLARRGLWSVAWGDPRNDLVHPSFFWEVYRNLPLTSAALLRHTAGRNSAELLESISCATFPSLYHTKNSVDAPESMQRIIIHRLFDCLVNPENSSVARTANAGAEISIRHTRLMPSPIQLGFFLLRRSCISAFSRMLNRRTVGQWFSAYRSTPSDFTNRRASFSPAGFQELPLRASGYGCADPFPVSWRDRNYIFAEEILPNGHGRLVVYSTDDAGKWKKPPDVILEASHHLSYPCVFKADGTHFLIPESSANGRVELWRAEEFPFRWILDTVYAENVRFVDTTPFYDGDHWYFFTSTSGTSGGAGELFLYYASDLRGPWLAHPVNPICSDVRASRMAGHLFWRQGRLIRPAQDCSGAYGRAIRLLEIQRLSTSDYLESEVELIDSSWHPNAQRTHTINASDTLETIDGWQRYRRGWRER